MPQETKSFWDSMYDSGRDYRFIKNQTLRQIIETADIDGNNVLDIGCGTGQLTRELYHLGFSVTGIDISPEAIKAAKSASKYIDYREMDFESDPTGKLGTGKFDLITCKLVFAFVKNPEEFIEQVKKLLRNNGAFVIITPTLEQVEEEKQAIAVNHEKTHGLLESTFASVSYFTSDNLTVYITHPKTK
ncbi:hypothetical protein BRC19_01330 [Candidatus Saccharibacteria bacterium QS_5_54_17]|nr:MAG: hypothetical protein BRC19_01330 [Candidatus Saccharibacteria bacterium QS_5_54_17]